MMEQLTGNGDEQGDSSAGMAAAPFGKTLREARERSGLSVADVAEQIKFAPRQIEALEAGDFQHLPEMTFVRGFVRSYAKILHLDAQPLLAALPQTNAFPSQLAPASVEVPFPSASSPHRQNLIWLGTALLLSVLVVAFAVWHYTTPVAQPSIAQPGVAQVETPVSLPSEMHVIPASPVGETEIIAPPAAQVQRPLKVAAQSSVLATKPLALQVTPQFQSAKPVTQLDTPPQNAALRLVFDEESWTEIKDKDDKIISSQVNPRGSELRLDGRAPFSLVIGHAASVRLYHRGKKVDLTPYVNSSSEVARLTLE